MVENNKIEIPKITKEEFWERLKKRKYEEIEVIKNIESFFLKKRGYVFKMPKEGEKVILLVSGGLDSVILWGLLLDIYKLIVYPISVQNDKNNPQYQSLLYYSRFFKSRYPCNFQSVFSVPQNFTPGMLSSMFNRGKIHPKRLLDLISPANSYLSLPMLGGLSILSSISAYLYREYLYLTKNIRINTIFCGVEGSDGLVVRSQTFTFLRILMLFLASFNRDFKLQFSSFFLEKETGIFLEKYQSIRLGTKLGIPLEKTYSCYKGGKLHCGTCLSCHSRNLEFRKAGVLDQTVYQKDLWSYKFKKKIEYHLTNRTPLATLIRRVTKKLIELIKR